MNAQFATGPKLLTQNWILDTALAKNVVQMAEHSAWSIYRNIKKVLENNFEAYKKTNYFVDFNFF